jgi:hypothetical protein
VQPDGQQGQEIGDVAGTRPIVAPERQAGFRQAGEAEVNRRLIAGSGTTDEQIV